MTAPTPADNIAAVAATLDTNPPPTTHRLAAIRDAHALRTRLDELGLPTTPETLLAALLGATLQARASAAHGIDMMAAQARAVGLPPPILDPAAARIEQPLSWAFAIVARDLTTGAIDPPATETRTHTYTDSVTLEKVTAEVPDDDPVRCEACGQPDPDQPGPDGHYAAGWDAGHATDDEPLARALATLLGATDRYDGDLAPITGDAHLLELLEPIIAAAGPWLARHDTDEHASPRSDHDALASRIRHVLDTYASEDGTDHIGMLMLDLRAALTATDTACTRCAGTGAILVAGERRPCPGDANFAPHATEEG